MRIPIILFFTILLCTELCVGIYLIDLPYPKHEAYKQMRSESQKSFWTVERRAEEFSSLQEEKDANIKTKISTLVQQTMHDTERKIQSIQHLKEKNREEAPYRAGFILSMIKKNRDVLNELFNVAVKHRDEWKALEQLKIFELIVHTNVDTTNLVRQLVEIHIQHINATSSPSNRRVVLL
ncbi:hypothetical protein K1T71_006000 [Dendrolimus kikuchii]|uniref:Uncharacterized protein n=1 Tax=Dendrolimus kikuchii TaxID=765133 RepID=A0ACC1D465_9NEOP|nr:hypothetical protein K1T71_006000 [Dendrolimus kikuchii]